MGELSIAMRNLRRSDHGRLDSVLDFSRVLYIIRRHEQFLYLAWPLGGTLADIIGKVSPFCYSVGDVSRT